MSTLKIFGIAVGAALAGAAALLTITNPGSAAETAADAKDENLRARRYKTDLQTFAGEAEKIIPTLSNYGKNWKLASADVTGSSAVIKAEVPVVVFTDDLEIKAAFDAEIGETTVNIHSAARLGSSDLGENRRHILQILKALDERFDY